MGWRADSDAEVLRELGRRLRDRRLARNWTQSELAERAGINRTTLGDLERGESANLTTFIAVLRALGALDQIRSLLADAGADPPPLTGSRLRRRRRATGRRGRHPEAS